MRQCLRFVVTSTVVAFASHIALAEVVQLPLTYNADVVREPGGTITAGGIDPATNAGPGGRGFVTQSEAAANDPTDPHGLPDNRIISVPGGTIQLQPYNANNALLLATPQDVFGYTADQLAGFDTLEIYGAGNGAVMGNASGTSLQAFFDNAGENGFVYGGFTWDAGSPNATFGEIGSVVSRMDRTGPGGVGFEDVDNTSLIRWSIPLHGSSPLNFVSFKTNPNGGPSDQRIAILAVTATRVPEPSPAVFVVCAGFGLLLPRRRR